MIYSILALFLSILSLLKRHNLLIIIISIVVAFTVSFFDLPDNNSYQNLYEGVPPFSFDILYGESYIFNQAYGEIGYKWFISLFKVFGLEYIIFRFLVFFIIVYSKLYFFKYFISNQIQFSLCVLIYFSLFFYVDSYILRQSLATSILCYSFILLHKRKIFSYLGLIGVASLFHTASILALVLLVIVRKQFTKKMYLFTLTIIFIIGLFGMKSVILDFLSYIPSDYIFNKITRYSNNQHGEAIGLLRGSVLFYTMCFVFCVFYMRVKERHFLLNIYLVSLLFLIGFNDFGVIGERSFRLFAFIIPMCISSLVLSFKREDARFNYCILYLFLFLIGLVSSMGYRVN